MEVRRDQWGRYLVVPPSGGRPMGYTRATTVAKALDDGGGLIPWKATLAMTGLMRRPGLRGRFEALYSAHPDTGPWYGTPESKTAAKQLVEECAQAGGSSDRADVGTALHAIVEQINRGQTPVISQDSTRADVDAYRATIAAAGLTFDPESIEATVVLDAWKVAGTADGARVHLPAYGNVVADLKTGTNLDYSWQSIAVQLAIYAHGDNLYRQGGAADGSEDVRLPVPDVRQDVAVVIHVPAGEARCVLYEVDIAAGWEAFERSMWARRWRSRRDLATPITVKVPEPADTDAARRELLERVLALPAERQRALRDSWPAAMPPLKRPGDHWTPERLTTVRTMVVALSVAPGTEADTTTADVAPARETAGVVSTDPVPGAHTPTGPAGEEHGDVSPPADAGPVEYLPVDEWQRLDPDERARRIERGHLPPTLRTPPDALLRMAGEIRLLPLDLQVWLTGQARAAKLPHLSHEARWTKTHGERLRKLIEAAHATATERAAWVRASIGDGQDVRELIAACLVEPVAVEQLTAEQAEFVVAHAEGITFPCDWPTLAATAGLTKAAVQRQAKAIAGELGVKVPSTIERMPGDGTFALRLARWIREQTNTAAVAS